jgi:flavin reductase (DIM6/NTAB) family NADH-FMN oxidoreductase RutF
MNDNFKPIDPGRVSDNPFHLIGNDWMLITAGNVQKFNTMTASWGGMGILWRKKVCFIFVRPSRYTYEFLEENESFTLSFFEEEYRKVLSFCGTKSGRDVDKIAATGLTPVEGEQESVYFAEARLVMQCKKLYYQDLEPGNFLDSSIEENYYGRDYHRIYVGEIKGCYVKES